MQEEQSFEQAISSAQDGTPDSVAWLWKRHQPALKGWLSSFDSQIADDVASEAWIEALRGLDRFEGNEANFRSWLFTVARRRLIDRQRRENRRRDLMSNVPNAVDSNESAFSDVEHRQAIEQITRSLAPDHAEIVLLRVVGGFDVDTVATITDRSPGAVRVIQHRALRKLARSLQHSSPETLLEDRVTP